MSKSKQASKQHRETQDLFERQKIRHIKHDKLSKHMSDELEDIDLLSSADLKRLDGYEGF